MSQIHLFAVGQDIACLLNRVEAIAPIKYTLAGCYSSRRIEILDSYRSLPNLGIADGNSSVKCKQYLILDVETEVNIRPVRIYTGEVNYFVDQLINPDTVTFSGGGKWTDDIVLAGNIATVSSSSKALNLMKIFRREIRKAFTKVYEYYVGPEALLMLKAGKRLTFGDQATFGLTLPER